VKYLFFILVILGGGFVWFYFQAERVVQFESIAVNEPAAGKEPEDQIQLLFVGDIMLSRNIGEIITRTSPEFPFEKIAAVTNAADITIGNLEGPISNRGMNQGSEYSFRADPDVAAGLKFAGFDLLSLANNHIWDWGTAALADTLQILEDNEIQFVGAGRTEAEANTPAIIEKNGLTLAFLSYTNLYPKSLFAKGSNPGVSAWDPDKIIETTSALKHSSDLVVILLHWGEEYETQTRTDQRSWARELIEAGADLVVGHHPHVVQEIEQYKQGWIAYSLGNFVFDQNFDATRRGLVLAVNVKAHGIDSVRPMEIQFTENFQPEVAAGR